MRTLHFAWTLAATAAITLTAWSASAGAATTLQGFYEARLQASRADETLQLDRPNHYLELRVLSSPWQNVEGFLELSASSDRFRSVRPGYDPINEVNLDDPVSVHDPEVFFNEGHVQLGFSKAKLLFFSGQNRFWFSQPLLNVVDGNTLQDDFFGPRSQAVRLDFWNIGGFQGLAYYGDKATSGEDFVAGRATRQLVGGDVLVGATAGRIDYQDGPSFYDMTAAVDVEFALGNLWSPLSHLGRTTLVAEAARNLSGAGSSSLQQDQGNRNGFQLELRDVRIQDITFKANAWYREPFFYTRLASNQGDDDERGVFAEAWYRVPNKQVDLRYAFWGKRALQDISTKNERFQDYEHSLEAYGELKGGFSTWVKYREYHTNDNLTSDVFRNLIFELQAQNKLISVRPQVRIRDIGTPFEVQGYGMEINLNVTSDWKFFSRFLNAVENTESRRTIFLQTRYSGFSSAEFFIEYGDGGRSDRLTENDGFVAEGPSAIDQDGERRVQAFLKLWF